MRKRDIPKLIHEGPVLYMLWSDGHREKLDPLFAEHWFRDNLEALGAALVCATLEKPDDL